MDEPDNKSSQPQEGAGPESGESGAREDSLLLTVFGEALVRFGEPIERLNEAASDPELTGELKAVWDALAAALLPALEAFGEWIAKAVIPVLARFAETLHESGLYVDADGNLAHDPTGQSEEYINYWGGPFTDEDAENLAALERFLGEGGAGAGAGAGAGG